jgi:site-specific recombinase XerD
MYACGLRISEAATLEVTAIDTAQGVLRVIGKGDKERRVPLPEPVLNDLRRTGSVSFQGKLGSGQASNHPRLYQATEIRSRSAATRWTWMTRRQASETLWLM